MIYLDEERTKRLFNIALPEERASLAFLCLAMFHQDNCGECIYQDDIDAAKSFFSPESVDQVIKKWFIKDEDDSTWKCLIPISISDSPDY